MVLKISLSRSKQMSPAIRRSKEMALNGHKAVYVVSEIVFRLVIIAIFLYTEDMEPFTRIIQPEEWWLYKNPLSIGQRISTFQLYSIAVWAPLITITIFSGIFRNPNHDFTPGILSASLALVLNGLITNCIKLGVGRPRPDFFYRCFPNGSLPKGQPSTFNLQCTGDVDTIIEGRKSFPSGHSSFAFVSLGYCAIYMAGKMQCFNSTGRARSWRLSLFIAPLLTATLIAISRTCDYRHHWQDVTVGSLLGLSIAYVMYRQYYPSLSSNMCFQPYGKHSNKSTKELYDVSANGDVVSSNSVKHM